MVLVATSAGRCRVLRSEPDRIQRALNFLLRPSGHRARTSAVGDVGAFARLVQYDALPVVRHVKRAVKDKDAVIAVERPGPEIGAAQAQGRNTRLDFNDAVVGLGKTTGRETERAAGKKFEAIGNTGLVEHELVDLKLGILAQRQDRAVIEFNDQPGVGARLHDIEEMNRRRGLQRPPLTLALDFAAPLDAQDLANPFGGKDRAGQAGEQDQNGTQSN